MNTKVTMSVSDGRGMAQAALAQQYARIIEVQEQLEKLKRQAAAEEKAMYDSSCNPASATTHAKIVLGASVMALVLADDAKEGSLAYRIREYLSETMPRNKDRELFRLAPLNDEEIKSVRAQRQSRISAALGATRKQAEQLYADKKTRQAKPVQTQQAQPKHKQQSSDVNAENKTTLSDSAAQTVNDVSPSSKQMTWS